jgi:hypothetical protein
VNFAYVNAAALAALPGLLQRLLPGGRQEGSEYVALNPRRADRSLGSFRVNFLTGRWADFAIEGARGGDVVALAAYIFDIGQCEAARRVAALLGISTEG